MVRDTGAAQGQAQIETIVRRLRARVAELIDTKLERSLWQQQLATRIREARGEFKLRPWRPSDAERLVSLIDTPTLWVHLPEDYPEPVTIELARDLVTISNAWPERHLVNAVEWKDQTVGQVRLQFDSSPDQSSAEISYWLGVQYQGRGFGTRLVTLFTADSFAQRPELLRIFARVLDGNRASMRVLEKAGYHLESFDLQSVIKRGRRVNTHAFAVSRADYSFDRAVTPAH